MLRCLTTARGSNGKNHAPVAALQEAFRGTAAFGFEQITVIRTELMQVGETRNLNPIFGLCGATAISINDTLNERPVFRSRHTRQIGAKVGVIKELARG